MAAQLGDLQAARDCGFQTIYVERVDEEDWGAEEVEAARREGWVDMWIGLEDARGGGLGGLADVRGRFAAGNGYLGGRGWGGFGEGEKG